MKFRKKPVVVEAVLWDGTEAAWNSVADLAPGAVAGWEGCSISGAEFSDLCINTLEGMMRARVGDYVIRGIKGELYPCKPDIFEATYELVEGQ